MHYEYGTFNYSLSYFKSNVLSQVTLTFENYLLSFQEFCELVVNPLLLLFLLLQIIYRLPKITIE